nr:potassium channel family protein [uncultured Sphingorhabdus sp.]
MARPEGRPRFSAPLRRASKIPVWADVLLRLSLAFFLILVVIVIHWFDRAGLKDNHDGVISFLDVVYFTMISVTTTGFGDIAPISDRARFIEAIIVTPVRIAVIFIFVGTAYNFVIKRSWEKWRMKQIQQKLSDHIVTLGFGISGSQAVLELIKRGTNPQDIVVVDCSEERLAEAEDLGCNILCGDGTRDEILNAVRIAQASSVIVSAGRDDASILMVLTVRHLSPNVPISVVIRADDNELLARQAGATTVINPVSFTGLLLASSCHGEHISEYLTDLASVGGEVLIKERVVAPNEVGKRLRELPDGIGLRVYRNGKNFGFWEPEAEKLEAGDLLVQIIPSKT